MPNDKRCTKAAVGNNIRAEQAAGKGKKQSLAIALNIQRKACKGGKPK